MTGTTKSANLLWLGLLVAAISVLTYFGGRTHRYGEAEALQSCIANQQRFREALYEYRMQSGGWGFNPAKLEFLVPQFVASLPRCPSRPDADYHYQRYSYSSAGANFVIVCPGNHKGIPSGFPRIMDSQDEAIMSPSGIRHDYQQETPVGWNPRFKASQSSPRSE